VEISDSINDMKDRIIFIRSIVELFASKARLKLDPKKLYVANNQSVSEMQKIAKMLYKA
jgi:clusterin-associated protein 1